MVDKVENLVSNKAELILGNSYPISSALGAGTFEIEGNRFARNSTVVTDLNLLDPILQAHTNYLPSGGQNSFNQNLGMVTASTIKNNKGTVIVSPSGSTSYFRSIDNGETFSKLSVSGGAGFTSFYKDAINVSPTTGTFVAGQMNSSNNTVIVRSVDDGITFQFVTLERGTNSLRSLSVFCDSTGVWYCSVDARRLYVSQDDGVSWTYKRTIGGNVHSFCEGANGRVFAACDNGQVWYTENKGNSWTQAAGTLSSLLTAISYIGNNNGSHILIANSNTSNAAIISFNNGTSFQPYTQLKPYGDHQGAGYGIWSDGNGVVVFSVHDQNYSGDKDRQLILVSTDFGQTVRQTGSVKMSACHGFKEGANARLFASAVGYHATQHPEPFVYLDKGFQCGVGDVTTDGWATLIKKRV